MYTQLFLLKRRSASRLTTEISSQISRLFRFFRKDVPNLQMVPIRSSDSANFKFQGRPIRRFASLLSIEHGIHDFPSLSQNTKEFPRNILLVLKYVYTVRKSAVMYREIRSKPVPQNAGIVSTEYNVSFSTEWTRNIRRLDVSVWDESES